LRGKKKPPWEELFSLYYRKRRWRGQREAQSPVNWWTKKNQGKKVSGAKKKVRFSFNPEEEVGDLAVMEE